MTRKKTLVIIMNISFISANIPPWPDWTGPSSVIFKQHHTTPSAHTPSSIESTQYHCNCFIWGLLFISFCCLIYDTNATVFSLDVGHFTREKRERERDRERYKERGREMERVSLQTEYPHQAKQLISANWPNWKSHQLDPTGSFLPIRTLGTNLKRSLILFFQTLDWHINSNNKTKFKLALFWGIKLEY